MSKYRPRKKFLAAFLKSGRGAGVRPRLASRRTRNPSGGALCAARKMLTVYSPPAGTRPRFDIGEPKHRIAGGLHSAARPARPAAYAAHGRRVNPSPAAAFLSVHSKGRLRHAPERMAGAFFHPHVDIRGKSALPQKSGGRRGICGVFGSNTYAFCKRRSGLCTLSLPHRDGPAFLPCGGKAAVESEKINVVKRCGEKKV